MLKREMSNGAEIDIYRLVVVTRQCVTCCRKMLIHEKDRVLVVNRRVVDDRQDHGHDPHGSIGV